MSLDQLINSFATLMVLIDPPGLVPIFLGLTGGMSRNERFQVAWRACLIGAIVLIVFALGGIVLLTALGISMDAFRIAGGILLFWIAFEMIFEKRQERHERSAETAVTKDQISNIAVFPMAIPLIAGPAAISAVILLASSQTEVSGTLSLMGLIIAVIATAFVALLAAEPIDRILGTTGRVILTRLLGVILAALAVQFVADGVLALVN